LRRVIETGGLDSLQNIVAAIRDSGALERSYQCAQDYAKAAQAELALLPASPAKSALLGLADYAVNRVQ
jgi:octaprenyl-diphosphate synthase